MITREGDWERRLVAYANDMTGRRLRWGRTDCLTVARGALLAVYGTDLLSPVRTYRTRYGARRATPQDVPAVLRERGARELPLSMVQQGDLLIFPDRDRNGLPRFAVMVDGRGRALTADIDDGVTVERREVIPPETTAWTWRPGA